MTTMMMMEATMRNLVGVASRSVLLGRCRNPSDVPGRSVMQRCPVTAVSSQHPKQQQRLTGETATTTTTTVNYESTAAAVSEDGASSPASTAAAASDATTGSSVSDGKVKSMDELNGPTGWPIVGNFLTYLKKENRGQMHQVQARLHKTYGSMFREKWGTNWQVHVSDPTTIEVVYRHEGRYPQRPPLEPWILYRKLVNKPCGLFTAQGPEWLLYRTELSKRILDPQTTKGLIPPLSAVADDLVHRIRHVRDGQPTGEMDLVRHLPNEMYNYSLEAAGTFLFETRLGCLEEPIPVRTQQFIDATQEMLTSSLYLIIGEKIHEKLNTRFWRRHRTAWDNIFQIVKELIDKRIKELLEEKKAGQTTNRGVFLTYLLANNKITMDQVHANVTELMVAGTDTLANSFCFIAHLLASHESVQEKLYEEVTSLLGPNDEITSSALDEMRYLKCVIKESMRLYPVVTMNCRILDEDVVLNGHLVPKKTLIVVNHYASGHDNAVFPNASQFQPERWMREESSSCPHSSSFSSSTTTTTSSISTSSSSSSSTSSQIDGFSSSSSSVGGSRHHPFACLPFGFGKRNCAGQRVAKMELMIVLIKVLREFRLEPYPGIEMKPILRTLLTPGEHVPVRFVDRTSPATTTTTAAAE